MTVNFSNSPYKDLYKLAGTPQFPVNSQPLPAHKTEIASLKIGDVENNGNNKDSSSKKKIFGIIGASVGSVALLTLIGLFTLSKGFSGNFAKKIADVSDKFKNSIYDLTAESKKLTVSQKLKLQFAKVMQPVTDTLQASSNVSAVKDSFVNHWLKKLKMDPAIDKINKFFKNIVLKTKNNSYNEAEIAMVDFCNQLRKTNNPELIRRADAIERLYAQKFSTAAHVNRSEKAWDKMKNLHQEVYDTLFKDNGLFKNLKKYRSYITTDKIEADRNIVQNELKTAKTYISNSIDDVYNSMKKSLYDVKVTVNPQNKAAVEIVKSLSDNVEKYKTLDKSLNGAAEKLEREKIISEIKKLLNNLSDISKKDSSSSAKINNTQEKIKLMLDSMNIDFSKKGIAQEAMSLIDKKSPEYKLAKEYLAKMNSKLNLAIENEMNSYEKLAELRVGSAPTDILGILGPSAIGTLMVVNSKDKNERISKTLTQGIPILGSIGVAYYGTTRGWTGAKNLILGLLTGWVLNVIGGKTDEAYKKYAEKQNVLKTAFESFTKLQKHSQDIKSVESSSGANI